MAFRLKPDEYFHGTIREPDGDREITVVEKGARAVVVELTVRAARKRNWDWVIELRRQYLDEDFPVATLGHWSSMQGRLPPARRGEVPWLN